MKRIGHRTAHHFMTELTVLVYTTKRYNFEKEIDCNTKELTAMAQFSGSEKRELTHAHVLTAPEQRGSLGI